MRTTTTVPVSMTTRRCAHGFVLFETFTEVAWVVAMIAVMTAILLLVYVNAPEKAKQAELRKKGFVRIYPKNAGWHTPSEGRLVFEDAYCSIRVTAITQSNGKKLKAIIPLQGDCKYIFRVKNLILGSFCIGDYTVSFEARIESIKPLPILERGYIVLPQAVRLPLKGSAQYKF